MKRFTFTLGVLISLAVSMAGQPVEALFGDVRTWMSRSYAGDGLDARQAWLDNPGGLTADSACNLYIADSVNNVIRRIDGTTNLIRTFAGNGHVGATDGAWNKSSFNNPEDVVLGGNGELFVADTGNGKIRMVKNGAVGTWLSGFRKPSGLLLHGATLFVSEMNADRITKANRLAGTRSTFASLTAPSRLAELGDDIYVIHNNHTALSKINRLTGVITLIKNDFVDAEGLGVGNGLVYVVAGDNGIMNEIWTYNPGTTSITRIANVAETEWYNHGSDATFCGSAIRLLFRAGSSVYTDYDGQDADKIAGIHRWGDRDGLRSVALVGRPSFMVLSPDKQKFYLLENQKVKEFNLVTKTLSFLAGHANDNYVDGVGNVARVSGPTQMAVSTDGAKLYIADRNNNRIRVLDIATRAMTTLVGAGRFNMFNEQNNAYAEGGPCATTDMDVAGCAYFNRPMGIVMSRDGKKLYVADSSNARIRSIDVTTGQTTLVAGGTKGFLDGVGSAARFNRPSSLLLSKDGTKLYVVDFGNHAIRQITLATGRVVNLMGKGRNGYRNGPWRDVVLSYPDSLAHGAGNNIYLSEVGSQRIREIHLNDKTVSLLAGSGRRGMRNGVSTDASFNNPKGMVMIGSTLLVADSMNDLIRSVSLK